MNLLSGRELAELIDGMAGLPYAGEAVDQRTHALQAGWLAARAGADDELLLAAVLHDVGRTDPVRAAYPDLPHEHAGAEFARARLSERLAWMIAAHVSAKRYLVATDLGYASLLSPASAASLRHQGGPMDAREVATFGAHPMAEQAVLVRRWDDAAKNPHGPVLTPDQVLAAHDRWVAAPR